MTLPKSTNGLTREEKLAAIREACVKAQDRQGEVGYRCEECGIYHTNKLRPIRLASVFLALQFKFKEQGWMDISDEELRKLSLFSFDTAVLQIVGHWNKRNDCLDEQSDECISFLAPLLATAPSQT